MTYLDTHIRSFNIEITNRCVLECSECPRTGSAWVKDNLSDLPVSVLERIFPLEGRAGFEGLRVNLCGAHGDCIYHPRFHEIIAYLKSAGLSLCVETNGSHRRESWWKRTCELLDDGDVVTFSVDGLEDTNHIYRVNARWPDVERAMRYCAARVPVVWKFIVFAHNEHQIGDVEALARDIGVRDVIVKKSGRFAENDPLAPRNDAHIGVVTRNRPRVHALTAAGTPPADFDREVHIRPKCVNGKDVAVTALGYLFPCTSCESADAQSWFMRNREHFDLRRYSPSEIVASSAWRELEDTWASASRAPAECLYYCGVHREFDEEYREDARADRPAKPQDARIVSVA